MKRKRTRRYVRWDRWSANVRVIWNSDDFSKSDVLNLMHRAGLLVGVGEQRLGVGWGRFVVIDHKEEEIMNRGGVRAELLALRDANGLINPRVAERWAARHPKSHLAAELEWDNEVAAVEHRVNQIRQLISVFVVEVTGVREFVSLSIDRVQGLGYRTMESVVSDESLRDIMLQDALTELERMKHRYHQLQQLAGVWKAAGAARAKAKRRAGRKASPPPPRKRGEPPRLAPQ